MKHRNLINSTSERIKSRVKGWSKKTAQRVSYAVMSIAVVGLVVTSFTNSSNAQVDLPGASISNSINTDIKGLVGSSNSGVSSEGASVSGASGAQSNQAATSTNSSATTASDVKAANIASDIASDLSLSSSSSVTSSAESANVSAQLAQSDTTSVSKQQIVEPTTTSKSVVNYTVKNGDNALTVAQKYGVSDQTIRWANNLTDDNLTPGANLVVPTVDGVVYTVKDGDNLQSIAQKYGSNVNSIMTINNLNVANVPTGTVLLLPDANLPENERPGYVDPATIQQTTTTVTTSSTRSVRSAVSVPTAGSNTYAYGYCTWYAFNRRVQLGLPVANRWGNANTWDTSAARAGYLVNTIPTVGAIFQTDSGPYGHVGIVERVNSDGSIYVSEMNYSGWNVMSYRTINNLRGYKFIH